jgi:hypothetical protein
LRGARFWCASAASLPIAAFAHRVLRWTTVPPDAKLGAIFLALMFLVYVAAILRGARRISAASPDEAQAELLRVAGVGFVLVYFALEMS